LMAAMAASLQEPKVVLQPFGLTHVVFRQDDRIGFFMAAASLAPIFIVVAFITTLTQRRDLATASFFAGQLVNEAFNWVLKHTIKEARPVDFHTHAPRYGMPSNHSQFMAFTATFLTLWAIRRWQVGVCWRVCLIGGVQALAALVMYSRVHLQYHSVQQVVVGGFVGAALAAAWFALQETIFRPRFPEITRSRLGRLFLVRDCTNVNVVQAEYAAVMGPESAKDRGKLR
jgi:dolichyldiphosphatase